MFQGQGTKVLCKKGVFWLCENNKFDLQDEDYCAILVAMNTARRLIRCPRIKPLQIIALGKALYALERLPESTSGIDVEFSITCRTGDENFHEMVYIDFIINEKFFEISKGGSVCEKSIGCDSYSWNIWYISNYGYDERTMELYHLEDMLLEYFNMGAKINIDDRSGDIDYDYDYDYDYNFVYDEDDF